MRNRLVQMELQYISISFIIDQRTTQSNGPSKKNVAAEIISEGVTILALGSTQVIWFFRSPQSASFFSFSLECTVLRGSRWILRILPSVPQMSRQIFILGEHLILLNRWDGEKEAFVHSQRRPISPPTSLPFGPAASWNSFRPQRTVTKNLPINQWRWRKRAMPQQLPIYFTMESSGTTKSGLWRRTVIAGSKLRPFLAVLSSLLPHRR